jgi:hypothetical protein
MMNKRNVTLLALLLAAPFVGSAIGRYTTYRLDQARSTELRELRKHHERDMALFEERLRLKRLAEDHLRQEQLAETLLTLEQFKD